MSFERIGIVSTAFGVSLAFAGSVFAQQNTLRIDQNGDRNTLTIDQSKASFSIVGAQDSLGSRQSFAAAGTSTEFGVDPNPTGSTATSYNSFWPNVSGFANIDTARQTGIGNSASVTLGGAGGSARLLQDSSGFGTGNSATVTALDGSNVVLGQLGSENSATLTVRDGGLNGGVLQKGNGNRADLSVTGKGASGLISQIGDNNNTGLSVTGAGTTVSYVVQGSNLQSSVPGGLGVTASGVAVQVTQMAMPGISSR